VPAFARQADDREGGDQPGQTENDDVIPGRDAAVAEVVGQVGEDQGLELVDQLEEGPGRQRDADADDRRQRQQAEKRFRPRLVQS
jgi:hypothetical protein